MSSHFLTDKSLALESRFGGWRLDTPRAFAEPGVTPHYAPSRCAKLVHLDVELQVDPVAQTLVGRAVVHLAALPGGSDTCALDLDEVVVDAVEDLSGAPLAFRHEGGQLVVPVGTVVVRWHGHPRRGLYFVGPDASAPTRPPEAWTQCQDEDAKFIFPCFDHPSVKHTWTITLVSDPSYTTVSNGRCVAAEPGRTRWSQDEPMPAYLFSAVFLRADVHEAEGGGVQLRYVVPAGTPAGDVARAFGRTPAMMAFLAERYGPYPWPRYDQVVVHDFVFGGMENVAATTLIDIVLTDARAALDWDADDLVVHELAHQWFGDLVTCQDWSQGWLNEGWATYTEHQWLVHAQGQDEGDYHLYDQLKAYLEEDKGRYRRPMVSYLFREPIDVFDRHIYEKGSLVLHTLRHHLGEDGFWAGVRLYLDRHRHGTVHTRHFQRALEDATGRNLDAFFAQYVLGAGHPTLDVKASWDEGCLRVVLKQTQSGPDVAETFEHSLRLTWAGPGGVTSRRVRVDQRETTCVLPLDAAPTWLSVDGGFEALAEIELSFPRPWLLAALREDPRVIGRIRAAAALAKEGSPEAMAALGRALREDPFWGVRAEVADLLGERGGADAAGWLVSALADAHPRARRRIVTALGSVRRPEVIAALEALPPDASVLVEAEVARSLGRLRAAGARARCEANLARSSWAEVLRARAAEGLGATRELASLPALLAATGAEHHARTRAAAAAALATLGNEVEAARTEAVERLVVLAEEGPFRVQVAAISALGNLRDARAAPVLERVHASAGDGRCRRVAFEALRKVREGRNAAEGLATLRGELERMADEHRRLRERVGSLESHGGR